MDRPALNEEEREARQPLANLLRLVLSCHCSYLEAVPRVVYLGSRLGGVRHFDDDFKVFVGINSETDHLPTQATRRLWSAHAIKALEPDMVKLETRAAALAKVSCEALLARFDEAGA
jgi:hypothetical protein